MPQSNPRIDLRFNHRKPCFFDDCDREKQFVPGRGVPGTMIDSPREGTMRGMPS
jgi:hypothetical protein